MMDILDKIAENYSPEDAALLKSAYDYAESMHNGQKRASGEPYFTHPCAVAEILVDLGLDTPTVAAAFLHDVVEDTPATEDDILRRFGKEVMTLVDGVTKLDKIQFRTHEEEDAENFRKIFVAMANDVRVIIIKLADRLHNMRSLNFLSNERQQRIAKETLEIFTPLAGRLGISQIKCELEDLCLKYLDPEAYEFLVTNINQELRERKSFVDFVVDQIKIILDESNIDGEVIGRPKHFYSIFRKMKNQNKTLDQIYDLTAVRVIVDTTEECYEILGKIHKQWKPVPGRIKDYIATPKRNMYQSLHTTVVTNFGQFFEIQIRTVEMHKMAEYGIAAHWKYKEHKTAENNFDARLSWIRDVMDWQGSLNESKEFVDSLKNDLYDNELLVFTPHGKVISLPREATPVDFAYAIHSQVGHTCVGAKINGRIAPLKVKLNSGDKVEILTSQTQEPRKDWLNIVKTNRAYSRISAFLRKKDTEKAILTGREILNKEFKHSGLDFEEIISDKQDLKKALDKFSVHSLDELITHVGFGQISARKLLHLFLPDIREEEIDVVKQVINRKLEPFKISGVDNMMIKTAKCCSPLPGDAIKGYVSTGRGLIVHKADCPNITRLEENKDRIVDVEWDNSDKLSMPVKYKAILEDISGVFVEISTIIKDMGLNIHEMNIKNYGNGTAKMEFVVMVKNKKQSDMLSEKICSNKHVISVKQS